MEARQNDFSHFQEGAARMARAMTGPADRVPVFAQLHEFAAEYLGIAVHTVYRMSRLRELPSVKVGRALRFDVVALERYVEQHTIATVA